MAENAMLYTAVYSDSNSATADLDMFEKLHKEQVIGDYDAAVIDIEDGEPHIVKRVDHPATHVIPEVFGKGALPRKELHEAARSLEPGEAALVVVGEPTLEQAFEKAVTRAARTVKREVSLATDELTKELVETFKEVS